MLRERAELSNLSKIRHDAVGLIEKLGVRLDEVAKYDIMLAVGEAITNIVQHSNCTEIGLGVAVMSGEVIVTLEAECYDDPDRVKSWFEKKSDALSESSESGRGDDIVISLCDVMSRKGAIDLIFRLARSIELAKPALATA